MRKDKQKLCVIYNTAPRYREAIFQAIDKEYECDWYFGKTKSDIKEMDLSLLKRTKYYKTFGNPNKVCVKVGVLKLLFKKEYQRFFILAEVRSLTDWVFFFLAYLLFPKKKVYVWTHGWYGREKGFDAKMKLWLYNHVDGTFVYGDRAKSLLIAQGIPESKLFVIYNSLQYDDHINLRATLQTSDIYKEHFQNNYPVIVVIGRLNMRKKLDLLLKSLEILKTRGESYNVIFIGDGEDRQSLEKLTYKLDLNNNVWFYGACYNELENANLIINADLCVVPGDIGLTAIHVMTFGIPVITHDLFSSQGPEFEVIKEGVTGSFFEYDNTEDLANKISLWFTKNINNRHNVRLACYEEIDSKWNPVYQMKVITENLR